MEKSDRLALCRRAMQRRCDTQAHGLAPGAARARQRVKGEAAPSSRRATPCKRHGAGGAAACARARDGARRMGVARLRVGATKERAQPPCLQVGQYERRRDHDPGTLVRDARELALDEDDGRHPLVTVYSSNT